MSSGSISFYICITVHRSKVIEKRKERQTTTKTANQTNKQTDSRTYRQDKGRKLEIYKGQNLQKRTIFVEDVLKLKTYAVLINTLFWTSSAKISKLTDGVSDSLKT